MRLRPRSASPSFPVPGGRSSPPGPQIQKAPGLALAAGMLHRNWHNEQHNWQLTWSPALHHKASSLRIIRKGDMHVSLGCARAVTMLLVSAQHGHLLHQQTPCKLQ